MHCSPGGAQPIKPSFPATQDSLILDALFPYRFEGCLVSCEGLQAINFALRCALLDLPAGGTIG